MDENNNVGDRQWLKFGILAGILLMVVLIIALLRPIIFGRIVPAVMGGDGETAVDETTLVEDTIIEEAPTDSPVDNTTVTDSTEETELQVDEDGAITDAPTETPVEGAVEGARETAVPTITYIVQAGDSIYSIARAYNLNPETIVNLNNIPNPNNILIGTELLIPQP